MLPYAALVSTRFLANPPDPIASTTEAMGSLIPHSDNIGILFTRYEGPSGAPEQRFAAGERRSCAPEQCSSMLIPFHFGPDQLIPLHFGQPS